MLFLHNTKSIDVSFDNIPIEIISERNNFILDQCAMAGGSSVTEPFKNYHEEKVSEVTNKAGKKMANFSHEIRLTIACI